MTPGAFRQGLSRNAPPDGLMPALQALWWAAKDDWKRAHEIVMAHDGDDACSWVHAYLHRVEGDLPNARWWYNRAHRPTAEGPLQNEWSAIVDHLLAET